ncbi:MAG: M10 family metallopeptidase [Roseibium sp.]|uniref:M10 family metallopeptidase n=1 Tax=Roseibium sp. TaxID=1936156 RepID=UPI003D9C3438
MATGRENDFKVVAGFSCSEVANTGETGSSTTSNSTPFFSADQIADQLTNGYWGGSARAFNVSVGGTISVNITGLTSDGQSLARNALELWSDATGLSFSFTSGSSNISFDDTEAYSAYNYSYRSGSNLTASFVNVGTGWVDYYGSNINSYALQTYIHEIGHALGLGHAGNYNGSANYGTSNHYANDSWQASVMSYFSQYENTAINASYAYALTPQVADVIAIRNLYGTTGTTRTGDTTYGDNADSGDLMQQISSLDQRISFTIIDDGGDDTIDFSSENSDQRIDLNEEAISDVRGHTGNLQIARGTVIENAIGGRGDDTLIGNAAANTFIGNDGRDTFFGEGGNDTVSYANSLSGVAVSLANTELNTGDAFGDQFNSIEGVIGSSYADRLWGNSNSNHISGGTGNDTIRGGDGDDDIDGGEGADVLFGGEGADTLIGGAGGDRVQYSDATSWVTADLSNAANNTGEAAGDTYDSIEHLYGSNHSDSLRGNSIGNWIWGDSGNDTLRGWGGNDRLDGGDGADVLFGGEGADTLIGGAGGDRVQYSDATSWVTADLSNAANNTGEAAGDTYDSIEHLYGSIHSDSLRGNSVGNWIWGGSGNDTLRGWGGNDRLDGGEGADVLIGGEGADTLIGGAGGDRAQYSDATSGVTADLANSANNTGEAAGDTYDSIEHLYGTSYSDSLRGDSGGNWLWGASGDDHIVGREGNDLLSGGEGADTFEFGSGDGRDVISDFSVGEDELYFTSGLSVSSSHEANVFGGSELDTILTLNSGDVIVLSDLSGISVVDLFG